MYCARLQDERDGRIHDSKCPAGLEHGTLPVHIQIVSVSTDAENAEVGAVLAAAANVGAVGIGNASQLIHGSNEGSHEE